MGLSNDLGWQPGMLGRGRALARKLVRIFLGVHGEEVLHGTYHDVLRVTGRFGPPEDGTTLAALRAVARNANTIIDVGANVGRYAWFLKRHAADQARLFALEPHPAASTLLLRTTRSLHNCVVLELAAGEHDTQAELSAPQGPFGSSVPALSWVQPASDTRLPGAIPVLVRRLDSLIDDGIVVVTDPVLVKIDVEGSEFAVLRGARELLRLHRPIIYLECQAISMARQGSAPGDLWDLLHRGGYRLFARRGDGFIQLPASEEDVVNYLAIPDLAEHTTGKTLDGRAVEEIVREWASRESDRHFFADRGRMP